MPNDSDSARLTRELTDNSPALLGYFQRRVGPGDAPDLLAEVMLIAWRRVGELPPDAERARMWLFVTARNVVANVERGERRRWRLANRLRLLTRDTAAPDASEGAEVRDAVARLDPDLAELVRLVHWDGLTLAEAAELLEIPASTARGRYQRARQDLRRALFPVMAG